MTPSDSTTSKVSAGYPRGPMLAPGARATPRGRRQRASFSCELDHFLDEIAAVAVPTTLQEIDEHVRPAAAGIKYPARTAVLQHVVHQVQPDLAVERVSGVCFGILVRRAAILRRGSTSRYLLTSDSIHYSSTRDAQRQPTTAHSTMRIVTASRTRRARSPLPRARRARSRVEHGGAGGRPHRAAPRLDHGLADLRRPLRVVGGTAGWLR